MTETFSIIENVLRPQIFKMNFLHKVYHMRHTKVCKV